MRRQVGVRTRLGKHLGVLGEEGNGDYYSIGIDKINKI
jgi:hypothetical protein